jgi:tetraacyldisaccharide-1-P 4'-kinase
MVEGETELFAFPDHWVYTASDAALIQVRSRGRSIVTTEKDAVKLEGLGLDSEQFFVRELVVMPGRGSEALIGLLDRVSELSAGAEPDRVRGDSEDARAEEEDLDRN